MLNVPLESEEARTFVAWLRVRHIRFYHAPSETGSDPYARRRAIRMKRQGTVRGFPDYCIVTNSGVIFIELKRLKGSTTSPEQREWIEALQAARTPAYIAKGAQEAIELVERHHNPNGVEF